jgi:precorrin-6x reductase
LVIDATHPYAALASANIRDACTQAGIHYLRLRREATEIGNCRLFSALPAMIDWLNTQTGTIFSSLGAQTAVALTQVADYRQRVWLRILPSLASLTACLEAGFSARQIICMQGPFSDELNAAMFRAAKADILLTKESGVPGGIKAKLTAARECGMQVAVLSRPSEDAGRPLKEIIRQLKAGEL